jgi:hypothetical protein
MIRERVIMSDWVMMGDSNMMRERIIMSGWVMIRDGVKMIG